jgi:hypothetical protein
VHAVAEHSNATSIHLDYDKNGKKNKTKLHTDLGEVSHSNRNTVKQYARDSTHSDVPNLTESFKADMYLSHTGDAIAKEHQRVAFDNMKDLKSVISTISKHPSLTPDLAVECEQSTSEQPWFIRKKPPENTDSPGTSHDFGTNNSSS